MGCNFNTAQLTATTEKEAREAADRLQMDLLDQYGHDTYAGHLGICSHVEVGSRTAVTAEEAEEAASDLCEKWGPALLFKLSGEDDGYWLLVGYCAS